MKKFFQFAQKLFPQVVDVFDIGETVILLLNSIGT